MVCHNCLNGRAGPSPRLERAAAMAALVRAAGGPTARTMLAQQIWKNTTNMRRGGTLYVSGFSLMEQLVGLRGLSSWAVRWTRGSLFPISTAFDACLTSILLHRKVGWRLITTELPPEVKRARVDKYEMGKFLGQGSYGVVRLARNVRTGEVVAIKIMDRKAILRSRMVLQLKREIMALKKVRHPYVVRLLELLASKSKIYLVMEYCPGGEMGRLLWKRGPMKEDKARRVFQQLIDAVDFCHSQGVYHRDLKPENMLLDASGNLKVADFGLSYLFEGKRTEGKLFSYVGTPAYMAPEILTENKEGYSGPSVDMWSCGVILYTLLAGENPFRGRADLQGIELLKKVVSGKFECPMHFTPEVTLLLRGLINVDPEVRFTTEHLYRNKWFLKKYEPPKFKDVDYKAHMGDIDAAFSETTPDTNLLPDEPATVNAFDLISGNPGFDLNPLFPASDSLKEKYRFSCSKPPPLILNRLKEAARSVDMLCQIKGFVVRFEARHPSRRGPKLCATAEILKISSTLHLVDLVKVVGDQQEWLQFSKTFSNLLADILVELKPTQPDAA